MDPAVGDQLGDRQPGDLAADGVEAGQDDRLGRVVDDQVDPGRQLQRPDVAALAADDPALHLVGRQVDDRDRVLGGVLRSHPLHRGDDDVAGLVLGLLAGAPLDRPGELDRVVLGLLADGLDQDGLGILGRQAGDAFERGDLLRMRPCELVAGLVQLALALQQLPIALLEHVGPLVELLVTLEEPALEAGQLASAGSRLFLRFALQPELLVLRLEDQLLLAGPRLRFDPTRLGGGGLDRLGGPDAPDQCAEYGSADGGPDGHRQDNWRIHSCLPPIRTGFCGRTSDVYEGAIANRTIGIRMKGLRPARLAHEWHRCRRCRSYCRVAYGGGP